MKINYIFIIVIVINFISFIAGNQFYDNQFGSSCPCSDQSLCNPVSVGPRKEFLGFSLDNLTYPYYDWSILTTIAVFYSPIVNELLCTAHSHDVRLVYGVSYPITQLGNSTFQDEWIQDQLNLVQSTYTDGLNFDVESPIVNETLSQLYTNLVAETNKAFKAVNPFYQVTVDVAWSPNCIDKRCYDYLGLSQASDFLIMMDYDERSQVFSDQCIASANSPPQLALAGIKNFTNLGISVDKLVMGLPWYGYNYPCISSPAGLYSEVCNIPLVPFRGANCSDAAGSQLNYGVIMSMLSDPSVVRGPLMWDHTLQSPYFNFYDPTSGNPHQMWFDDPQSIMVKVQLGKKLRLRGVAVWNIDFLNNEFESQSMDMWNSIGSFFS
ncbi:hypothetical protein DICPUDRAFT_156870 [Dictyostelium purpureum]|uniref:GH18 domain-containing protein n=1 Tax=Dictyostelium purpureum TaxID=5786 RepID=F0ZXN3_DICPU|nr:uncharacterized protein DICPUDRAFT_156870 [Dictyostelium purpureum]EGC31304.1 hypothetical protein DICPUDRAFT_156870 [Dictyostelium purpureum]|eukprot:XP_003292181.1 hypothetical protein DICPUDRAFT_156870 [Dictyostelium purpureum]